MSSYVFRDYMSLWEIRCLYKRLDVFMRDLVSYKRLDVYIRDYMSLWEIRCLYERLDVFMRD